MEAPLRRPYQVSLAVTVNAPGWTVPSQVERKLSIDRIKGSADLLRLAGALQTQLNTGPTGSSRHTTTMLFPAVTTARAARWRRHP